MSYQRRVDITHLHSIFIHIILFVASILLQGKLATCVVIKIFNIRSAKQGINSKYGIKNLNFLPRCFPLSRKQSGTRTHVSTRAYTKLQRTTRN